MSLAVGDNVFVNDVHPAKIVAFLDNNRCEVAWASGFPHGTVVLLDCVKTMFAQPTRRRCAPPTYFEQTSAQAKQKREAKKKSAIKKEGESATVARVGRKKKTNAPEKKGQRTNEPLSRREAAAQVATALRSRDNKQAARKKRAPAVSTKVPAAKPNRARVPAEAGIDRKPAAKPMRTRLRAASDEDKKPEDDVDESDSSDTERLLSQVYTKKSAKSSDSSFSDTDLPLSNSDETGGSSMDAKIKVEDGIPLPSSFTFQIGDNVWVKDGRTDHPAKVIGDFDNLLQIEWTSTGLKDIVEKSRVTSMDLTVDLDDGPRRSRRRRCEPIKNEIEAKKPAPRKVNPAPRNKKSKASVDAPSEKSTRGPRESKAATAVFTTNATVSTQICLDDDDNDAESQVSMEVFMGKETWKQPPAEGSCDKKKDGDRAASTSICGVAQGDAPRRRAPIQMEESPKVSQAYGRPTVSAERRGLDVARLLHDTPSKLESEFNVIKAPLLAASRSSPSSPTDAESLDLNESTETANPDEFPLEVSDERRLTADPAEMSQIFAYI